MSVQSAFFVSISVICVDITVVLFGDRFKSLADRFVYGISNMIENTIAVKYTITLMPVVITIWKKIIY